MYQCRGLERVSGQPNAFSGKFKCRLELKSNKIESLRKVSWIYGDSVLNWYFKEP